MARNVDFLPLQKASAWRKIAVGTWRSCGDPSIYGAVEVDATSILKTIADHKNDGVRITPTVVIAKAIAVALQEFPVLNSIIRFGRIYQRKTCDVFLQVSTSGREDELSGIVIREADRKSLQEIAAEVMQKSSRIKKGDDADFAAMKKTIQKIPGFLISPLLRVMSFLMYDLNFWAPFLNSPRDGFGSAMVTSVGMLGIDNGFAPLVPYSRCPLLIAVGQIKEKAIVENGQLVIRPILTLGVTIDHRLVDGRSASLMLRSFRAYLAHPH